MWMQRPTGRVVVQTPDGHVGQKVDRWVQQSPDHLSQSLDRCVHQAGGKIATTSQPGMGSADANGKQYTITTMFTTLVEYHECNPHDITTCYRNPHDLEPHSIGSPITRIPMIFLNHRIICDSAAFPAQVPLHHHHLQEPVGLQRSPALVGLRRHHPSTASC